MGRTRNMIEKKQRAQSSVIDVGGAIGTAGVGRTQRLLAAKGITRKLDDSTPANAAARAAQRSTSRITPSGGIMNRVTSGVTAFEHEKKQKKREDRLAELETEKAQREAMGGGGVAPVQQEINRLKTQQKYNNATYEDNFVGQAQASYAQGRLSQDEAKVWNDYLTVPTASNRKKAENASTVLNQFQERNRETLKDDAQLPWLTQSLAGYLPQWMDQTKVSLAGGLIGAGAGSVVPVVGTLSGAKAGVTAASTAESYRVMRGTAFKELLALGVDEETARKAANDEGFLSALVEMGDTILDVSGLGLGVGSLLTVAQQGMVKGFAKEGAQQAAEGAAKKLLKLGGQYGLNILQEANKEGIQQAVSIANRNRIIKSGPSQTGSPLLTYTDKSGSAALKSGNAATSVGELLGESVKTFERAVTGKDTEARNEITQAALEGGKIAAVMGMGGTILRQGTAHASGKAAGTMQNRNPGRVNVTLDDFETEYLKKLTDTSHEEAQKQFEQFKTFASGQDVVETAEGSLTHGEIKERLAGMHDEKELDRLMDGLLDEQEEKQSQAKYFGEKAGLVKDGNWKKAHLSSRDDRRLDALGKVLGTEIRFAETIDNGSANAKYENGMITLALDAEDPVMTSVIHEAVHRLKEMDGELYGQLSQFVQMNMGDRMTELNLDFLSGLYETSDQSVLTEELVADAFGVMLEDGAVLDQFVQDNRTAAQKVLDVVRDIINAVQRALNDQNLKLSQSQKDAFWELSGQLGEMETRFAQALKQAGETKTTATEGGGVRHSLKQVGNKQIVWVENSALTNKQLKDRSSVAAYIAQHIGEVYTIIESGQKVYIGKDLPGEYTRSKYSTFLYENKGALYNAKARATNELGLLIETATNRRWENTKHNHNKDAKFGMYRYDSSFAFPVKDRNGNVVNVRAYDVELLIRNASAGKKYLYDIVGIKENTTSANDLLNKETRLATHKAAQRGSASVVNVAQNGTTVNQKSSKKGRAQLDEYITKYGAITESERPVHDIQIPEETADDESDFLYNPNTQLEVPAEIDAEAFLYGLDSVYERTTPEHRRTRSDTAQSKTLTPEEVEKYGAIRYHGDGRIVVTDDWKEKEHPKVSKSYKPNAVVDTLSLNGKQWDRTIYDADGTIKLQIHGGNHGNPKRHSLGKHIHDYTWHSGRAKPDRTERKASILELVQHADILGGEDDDS